MLAALVVGALVLAAGDGPARSLDRRRVAELDGVAKAEAVAALGAQPREEGLLPLGGAPRLAEALAWLTLAFSALVVGQWVVLALSREYQEPLGRELELVAGLPADDAALAPRVRVDVRWLKKKLSQRVRGVLVLLPGFLAFTPVFLVTKPLGLDDFVMPPLMFGWSAYWWCTFTVGRSALAWEDEASGARPLPLRWWQARTEQTPGFRWFFPRWVGAFAGWAMKRDLAPAVAFERAPWSFVGLGLARLVTSPPLVRLAFRQAIDAAVTEQLSRR